QEPGDTAEETGFSATAAYSHYFQSGASLSLAGRSVRGKEYVQGYDNVGVLADGVTLRRRARQQSNRRDYDYFDGSFSLPFSTGPVEHKALVGLTYGTDVSDFERVQFYDCPAVASHPCNINVYHPVYGVAPPLSSMPLGSLNRRITTNTSTGVYVSDLMTLAEQWKLNLGLRHAHEKQDAKLQQPPTAPPTRSMASASKLLPTAGLLFMPSPEWTLYASYSTSYIPQAAGAQNAAGSVNAFAPQEGRQYEIGAKTELLGGRLNATLALFDIEKRNSLATAPCNPGVAGVCSQQVGAERSKGVELELNYAVTRDLQLIGGWAYTDAYVSETYDARSAPLVNAQLTNSSKNSGPVWARYDFPEGSALHDFGIGAGVNHNSETPGSLPSLADPRVLMLPSYTVADLAFYYRLAGRYDLTLKVGNLFDKHYFEGVNTTTNENGVVPGMPRNITFSVRIPLW
ncbi:MAG: TonB-dependent receptor, partial [Pseudaminobacter sp.]